MDYLPRDRMNLGMDHRLHDRLFRYFTIRPGTLYPPEEGLRLSILVTRHGRGGQRRDVATTVLDIMRERYQMAERVFYHHKKAAASAMLAKLTELAGLSDRKPRDDDLVYPAPWSTTAPHTGIVPHVTHLSDSELIEYLRRVEVPTANEKLRAKLYQALRYRRKGLYRTLLVIDSELSHASPGDIGTFANLFRENEGRDRHNIETELAIAANASEGDVLIYCPSPKMQAKEVDVRVEIIENRVLPLRCQKESFAYRADLAVLEQYYEELWRAYVFVAPEVFEHAAKCRAVVDSLCEKLDLPKDLAYKKVRGHDFHATAEFATSRATEHFGQFVRTLPFSDLPRDVLSRFFAEASRDDLLTKQLTSGESTDPRLSSLFEVATLRNAPLKSGKQKAAIDHHCAQLLSGSETPRLFANRGFGQGGLRHVFGLREGGLRGRDLTREA